MNISSIPVPAVYREESSDFRFFQKWFELCLSKIQYDHEEFFDLFDPLRCPRQLLWMLADSMGYKYDDRLSPAFNRLVLVYFMSMIRLKGSRDGVTLAAQVNLDQFNLQEYAKENDILNDRLEDTSIPVNSVYVNPNRAKGYIDVVYFSDRKPIDACIDYVRPLGMYLVPHAGVRFDAKTRISIDARLTNTNNLNMSIGSTHVGHYSREDYARLQRLVYEKNHENNDVYKSAPNSKHDTVYTDAGTDTLNEDTMRPENPSQIQNMNYMDEADKTGEVGNYLVPDTEGMTREERATGKDYDRLQHIRKPVWYRNSDYEGDPDENINPGYRAMYSLQLCNNEHIFNALIKDLDDSDDFIEQKRAFGVGYQPQNVSVHLPEEDEDQLRDAYFDPDPYPTRFPNSRLSHRLRPWNLRYDSSREEDASPYPEAPDVWTIEKQPYGDRSGDVLNPRPAVSPIMTTLGDAMSINAENTQIIIDDSEQGTDHNIHKIEPDGEIKEKITDKDDVDMD